ncbi:MAG TPA: hypothetical protein IAC75_02400 [Candidatus Spyradosoma merdigallinarum]|uniref:Uncharacterized protein n=1 Tax=Candidatus Spyradosoma merdigallinarum TaxID=2840950 RepID=A0A9D1T126_9BACT|nr:hypothetical protein [Candidatus Spyradosoma merdigallinarum]
MRSGAGMSGFCAAPTIWKILSQLGQRQATAKGLKLLIVAPQFGHLIS